MDTVKHVIDDLRQTLAQDKRDNRKFFNRSEVEQRRRREEEKREDEVKVLRKKQLDQQQKKKYVTDNNKSHSSKLSNSKSGLFEVDDSDMTEGQRNEFLELKKKSGMSKKRKATEDKDGDLKRMNTNFEDLCDEDKIFVFYNNLLNEWKQELDHEPDHNRTVVAAYMQCARDLNPLFDLCRKRLLADEIRQSLVMMVECCRNREYTAAMDVYLNKIAIGNAAWPIGVTMVGIHERSAREKIHTNSVGVAHIMNDETTRKLLYSVRRLITFCQRSYPTMPSKSVEFNSLANGSDLHSLRAQQEKLLIMALPAKAKGHP